VETNENYITILTATYPYELVVAQSILEAGGIVFFIKDELTALVNPLYSNAIGGIKLQVRPDDAEQAIALLKAQAENKPEEEELHTLSSFSEMQTTCCPNCGSYDVSKPKLSPQSVAISVLLLGFPLPFLSKTSHCFNCGTDFKNPK
jgi:hypothetical protein